MWERIKWSVKQLFPLTYWCKCKEEDKDLIYTWKMWLGRSYDVRAWEVSKEVIPFDVSKYVEKVGL
jgi:hypothetical protein